MPRRLLSYRLPTNKGKKLKLENVPSSSKQQSKTQIRSEHETSHHEDLSGDDFEQGSSQQSEDGEGEDNDNDEVDPDAPRVAIWEEDNEDFLAHQDVEENDVSDPNRLQIDLQNLPLGALYRAQQLLKQAVTDSESDISPDGISERKDKEKVEWSSKPLTNVSRRNKHAPVEMTAKKPVTRNRTVVDLPKIVARDPRFLPTAGKFDPKKFQQSYGFLAESRKAELQMLRESSAKARKMLASSPNELRGEREEEVERLERAMKRVESMVDRDRIAKLEQEALSNTKKEEAERRKQGKGKWFLKKADEKDLLMKARYEMLAKEGGQRAVKKAIEKRQKKMNQKEKRSRPYPSHKLVEGATERPSKRARV